jgi:hypothetical protein
VKRIVAAWKGQENQWLVRTDTPKCSESASEEYCDEQYGKTDKSIERVITA